MSFPTTTTPLDIKAWLYSEFGFCGCYEWDEAIKETINFLTWLESIQSRVPYDKLNMPIGVFYLLESKFSAIGLSEHGCSARGAWLTELGKKLLEALRTYTVEEIESAKGEVNGVYYE